MNTCIIQVMSQRRTRSARNAANSDEPQSPLFSTQDSALIETTEPDEQPTRRSKKPRFQKSQVDIQTESSSDSKSDAGEPSAAAAVEPSSTPTTEIVEVQPHHRLDSDAIYVDWLHLFDSLSLAMVPHSLSGREAECATIQTFLGSSQLLPFFCASLVPFLESLFDDIHRKYAEKALGQSKGCSLYICGSPGTGKSVSMANMRLHWEEFTRQACCWQLLNLIEFHSLLSNFLFNTERVASANCD